jgi:hypothetical protein
MERFSLKKLNEVEGKEQYLVGNLKKKIAPLENVDAEVDTNRDLETIR